MKYTKNVGNKLLNRGFKFLYNHTDEEINYDVYSLGFIEVIVDHTNKVIVVNMSVDDEELKPTSLIHLDKLIKLLETFIPKP